MAACGKTSRFHGKGGGVNSEINVYNMMFCEQVPNFQIKLHSVLGKIKKLSSAISCKTDTMKLSSITRKSGSFGS